MPAQPSGAGEVDDEVDLADGQVEELAVPADGGDRAALDGGQRRIVGFQDVERDRHRAGHLLADEVAGEEFAQCLDLWEFGHVFQLMPVWSDSVRAVRPPAGMPAGAPARRAVRLSACG